MIYELQILDTYYVAQYSTLTCTHEIFRKEAFTLKGTEYKTAVEWLNKFVGHGIIIDNDAKTGVRVVVANKITGKTAFLSDNYVFLDDKIYDADLLRELFSSCLEVRISKPRNYTKIFWWLIASLMVMGIMFSFKTCKQGWDEDRATEISMREANRESARELGIDNKEIIKALNGEKIKGEEDFEKLDTVPKWSNCGGNKKKCRELFRKKFMSKPDPYHDKNGKTRSIAGPGVHNYTEYEIKGDTLVMWSFQFGGEQAFMKRQWFLEEMADVFIDCGFVYLRGYAHEKKYYGDSRNTNFLVELREYEGRPAYYMYCKYYKDDKYYGEEWSLIEHWK